MNEILTYAYFIGQGAIITLQLLCASFSIGIILGALVSILRYKKKGLFFINQIISILRGTPIILQLSFIHFVLPPVLGLKFSVITTGIIAFGLNSSAYVAEILRGGIESMPKGQFEAARTLQIPAFQMWKDIILPQVFSRVLPSLINEFIALLKETAVISMIGGLDIMRQAEIMAAEKFTYFMPLCIAGVYYYCLVLLIEFLGKKLEKAYSC